MSLDHRRARLIMVRPIVGQLYWVQLQSIFAWVRTQARWTSPK